MRSLPVLSRLSLALGLLFSVSGCKERARIAAEVAGYRAEMDQINGELRATDRELESASQAFNALRFRGGKTQTETGLDDSAKKLEREVAGFTGKRDKLQEDVDFLKKDMAAYLAKYH